MYDRSFVSLFASQIYYYFSQTTTAPIFSIGCKKTIATSYKPNQRCTNHNSHCKNHNSHCTNHNSSCTNHNSRCKNHNSRCKNHNSSCKNHNSRCTNHNSRCKNPFPRSKNSPLPLGDCTRFTVHNYN